MSRKKKKPIGLRSKSKDREDKASQVALKLSFVAAADNRNEFFRVLKSPWPWQGKEAVEMRSSRACWQYIVRRQAQ